MFKDSIVNFLREKIPKRKNNDLLIYEMQFLFYFYTNFKPAWACEIGIYPYEKLINQSIFKNLGTYLNKNLKEVNDCKRKQALHL